MDPKPGEILALANEPGFGNGSGGNNTDFGGDSNTWYGVALYASYKLNKVVTLSARGEYLHEDQAWNSQFAEFDQNVDDFSETLTASFAIWDNLLTRVEYRYDHVVTGSTNPGNGAVQSPGANNVALYNDQNEISLEAVYSF